MIKASKASLGAIALALGGLALTCAAEGPDKAQRVGAKAAAKASKELADHDGAQAVADAEHAVALAPREAGFRMVLGQSYLQAGRFASARAAFEDTLQLDPANGRAALNLALAQTALGDWHAAQRTLAAHSREINDSDRGLALALAGDTAGAVTLLTTVARSPAATPKTRQNLALAYALGGQWQLARVVAAADMSPADVDARMEQWAAFAQPHGAADQVASLMGVRPARVDAGQPVALALTAPATAVPPVMAPAPTAVAAAEPAAPVVPVAVEQPTSATAVEVAAVRTPSVTFGPRHEVAEPLASVALIDRASVRYKVAVANAQVHVAGKQVAPVHVAVAKPVRAPAAAGKAGGQFVVQFGAYTNMAVAKHAWGAATRRVAALAGHQAQGVTVKTASATLFRLSAGGFSRADADRLCRAYRAQGGECFVRAAAGDQVARWTAPGTKVAAAVRPAPVKVVAKAVGKRVQVASR